MHFSTMEARLKEIWKPLLNMILCIQRLAGMSGASGISAFCMMKIFKKIVGGENRDIFQDMGRYIVIIYGKNAETEKEHEEILNRHLLKKDFYEFEDLYEHEDNTLIVRLYLCSSDYSVTTVSVLHR